MANEGERPLKRMFTSVPPSYDFLNRLLTFRMDECWRKKAVAFLLEGNPQTILDVCTGTGDLALRIRKTANHKTVVKALDYSAPMLQIANQKATRRKLTGIDFIQADAASIPFESETFDAIGIAFAFRNLTYKNPDTEKFLAEIYRVLKPGGRFVIVETSQPPSILLRKLVYAYLKYITVPLGGMISGYKGAYHYLAHSAIHYHDAGQVSELLMKKGFSKVEYNLLFKGVAALHIAYR